MLNNFAAEKSMLQGGPETITLGKACVLVKLRGRFMLVKQSCKIKPWGKLSTFRPTRESKKL